MKINIKTNKKCAFCKYWYDPTNSCISPVQLNFWEYDIKAKQKCLKRGIDKPSTFSCSQYECKVPIV